MPANIKVYIYGIYIICFSRYSNLSSLSFHFTFAVNTSVLILFISTLIFISYDILWLILILLIHLFILLSIKFYQELSLESYHGITYGSFILLALFIFFSPVIFLHFEIFFLSFIVDSSTSDPLVSGSQKGLRRVAGYPVLVTVRAPIGKRERKRGREIEREREEREG